MYLFLVVLFSLLLLIAALFFYLRSRLQDSSVPVRKVLIPTQITPRVMCIFPHPDDEIVVAGTLLSLADQGIETILITFTHGESGPTGGLVDQEALGDVRVKELQHSVDILKVSKHELFQYPDGGIASISSEKLKQLIYELILKHQPGLLITYDEFIGLYGHPDHRLTAQYTREVVDEHRDEPNFPVQALYVVTAPRKMIEVAMSISEEVRQAFHGDAGSRLPVPDFAMRIRRYAKAKSQAMHAHLSQHGVLSQFFPYHDHFPTWLYFFVFDREYFAKVL